MSLYGIEQHLGRITEMADDEIIRHSIDLQEIVDTSEVSRQITEAKKLLARLAFETLVRFGEVGEEWNLSVE